MHVHVDKPGTRWVALVAMGDSSTFVLDHAPACDRCFMPARREASGARKIVPSLSRAGTGERLDGPKEWHNTPCASCRELTLASGDCILFNGDPAAGVAHGCLGTQANTAPAGLPRWCYGGRVSCQYRLSAGFRAARGVLD
jgi:hypothetical protein